MSDNNVVATWSNYEDVRSRVEYETKMKYAEIIQRKITIAREGNLSNHFIFGLELAKSLVLNDGSNQVDEDLQPPLI